MAIRWQDFETQVRDIATRIYARQCTPTSIAGNDIDGFIEERNDSYVLFEITIENRLGKVRDDINNLILARNTLFQRGIESRLFMILNFDPTKAMLEAGEAAHVEVMSVSQLAARFIAYENYRFARSDYAFGSAIDPLTGAKDNIKYVPVKYSHRTAGRQYTVHDIADRLLSGLHVVLLGEYGSGKSRCIEELFHHLSTKWGETFQFPFAINLRDCWGLKRGEELIRRQMEDLGLDELEASAIRVFRQGNGLYLLDGFDELGMQSWSSDDAKLRILRAKALEGVNDLASKSRTGMLVAGREHYFSSHKEMLAALGLREADTMILYANDEFSVEEMGKYFETAKIEVSIPSWLPRRPLICQTIAQLDESEVDRMFGSASMEAVFWQHFMRVICERDARINASFTPETIYDVFIELSRLTRTKSANVGPINPREVQSAFEAVLGVFPVENAAVMLQRLPSLGRVGAESADRQFIDTYILDGLRGMDVAGLIGYDEAKRKNILEEAWVNPLRRLGQVILSYEMRDSEKRYVQLAKRSSELPNRTLAADIVSGLSRSEKALIDYENIVVREGSFSEFDLSVAAVKNLEISDSTFEEIVLPSDPPANVVIAKSLIGKISGASSILGLPAWLTPEGVDEFDSVKTLSRIRHAGLSRQHEIFVAIIKKTFFQPGAGRKEEALIRGFGNGHAAGLAPKILNLLVREKILTRFKGNEGYVYSPERANSHRMSLMLDQLRSSEDSLWKAVEAI